MAALRAPSSGAGGLVSPGGCPRFLSAVIVCRLLPFFRLLDYASLELPVRKSTSGFPATLLLPARFGNKTVTFLA